MAPVTAAVVAGVKNGKYKDKRAKLVAARQYAKRNEQLYRSSSSEASSGALRYAWSSSPEQEVEIISKATRELFKRHDTDNTGKLDVNSLTELLKQYASKDPGQPLSPSAAEVSWIVEAAGKSCKNSISVNELDLALQLWDSYIKNKPAIECLSNHNVTAHGPRLSFDQLKLSLSNLKGRPPKVTFCDHLQLNNWFS
jgi:hypothetical protein